MVRQREYLLTVNDLNEPGKVDNKEAIGVLLMRLLLLKPGSDPLHPLMGVGIENYRYALNKIDELRKVVQAQIQTFLPMFQDAKVEIKELTSEKICNIEITIDDTTYIYDSTLAPIPITLTDISTN